MPTVGPLPDVALFRPWKNGCDPSVSGAGCRPSGQGRMLPSTVVAGTRLFQAAGADRLPCRLLRALNKCQFPAPEADYRAGAGRMPPSKVWNMDGPTPS